MRTSPAADSAIWLILGVYFAFLALELAAAWVAFSLDREDKRLLWLQPLQRIVYRQVMYIAVWRALSRAAIGASQAWGKLRRTGDVSSVPRLDPIPVKASAPRLDPIPVEAE